MLQELLPDIYWNAITTINQSSLQEIRLRVGNPALVNVSGKILYLSMSGITQNSNEAIIVRKSNISDVLAKASNNSLYTINEQLCEGYVTVLGGIRIGVCGEVVKDGEKIQTIKNITSLNIRIPHEVKNCSLQVFNLLVKNGQVVNTLIVSAPGMGKTTFLRDFIFQVSSKLPLVNTLVVDERAEITGISGGMYPFTPQNIDVYTNCSKKFGFFSGIRSMKPNVIVTDEIDLEKDLDALENAMNSGVNVVATIHAKSIQELKNKHAFSHILNLKYFERFVLLNDDNGVGTIAGVYNSNLSCIYV